MYEEHLRIHCILLHYLYTMVDGLVIYAKAKTSKAKAIKSRRDSSEAKKFGLKDKAKD